ncbi:hypothetical protein G6F57_004809 [Rhizopus arrhizus]|uniref:Uncharacterized protein n=1 Tax=Rhizopus oryzae TaxID=64495 RepID=A0A9P6X306_RHIOR|nr:hypothetical protein G6F23_005064 [Rhizopus arrhizus]KAG0760911.1 hypothetical protein G6F24_007960 [Rhizopus arrhizus]KAG0792318.1 hypothetical protein G6F21_004446 [Rhizopus arrhizus]KAG0799343.1 hypothetical protein G6F22_003321 [Rhizopus arrhizus]KAG0809611.1 hypothetical protein G6F20_008641 [Rhizopus arrhizus]
MQNNQFKMIASTHQPSVNQSVKRSRMDDEDESIVINDNNKRYFDLHTQFSPVETSKEKILPAITYASPDYRPPPRAEVPLWLQPIPAAATSPATEDESEDDAPLLTPVFYQSQSKEYWGDSVTMDQRW